ncbi:MAG TPA: LLM class F420-dependent oxidoreductase [Asanoa sp.]
MRLCIFTEPQLGAAYADQLAAARTTEECGFEGYFRSDHYLTMGGDGLPGPTDSWVTLGALAVQTSRVRLGTMVSSATFRYPGPLAISVAQVDAMSGGRIELGIGAGWYEAEHTAYAIPFPPTKERFDRLEEQLQILTGLWTTRDRFSFSGKHYSVTDSPGLPKPVQSPHPPVIVGGRGPRRTPALAARFAAEYNVAFQPPSVVAAAYGRVDEACAAIGRIDPIVRSTAVTVACGRTPAGARSRMEAAGVSDDAVGVSAVAGTPEQVVDGLGPYLEAGAMRLFLQMPDLRDLDHIELIAAEVAPRLPAS